MPARPAFVLVSTGIAALSLGVLAPAAALADPPQDPPGNNGTIKIEPYGGTDGHANHPHPGCDFRLQLFGFDDGQTGTITFTGQAPTKDAVTAQPLSGTQQLSDDAAGGGNDTDAHFDVRGADLRLTGAPAKQGFHVKVRVDADNAPGGAKTKVFWLSCPAAASTPASTAPTTPEKSDTGAGTAAAPTATSTTSGSQSSTATTSVQGTATGTSTGAATAPTSTTTATKTTSATTGTTAAQAATESTALTGTAGSSAVRGVTGLSASGEAALPAVRSSGRTGAGGGLPFTGLPAAALAGLGLAVTTAGALAVAAGRRRRTCALDG